MAWDLQIVSFSSSLCDLSELRNYVLYATYPGRHPTILTAEASTQMPRYVETRTMKLTIHGGISQKYIRCNTFADIILQHILFRVDGTT